MLFQERTDPEILKPQSSMEKLLLFVRNIHVLLYTSPTNKRTIYETWKSLKFTLKYTQISFLQVSV